MSAPVHASPKFTSHALHDDDHHVWLSSRIIAIVLLKWLDVGVDICLICPLFQFKAIAVKSAENSEGRIQNHITLVGHGNVLIGVHHIDRPGAVLKIAANTANQQRHKNKHPNK